MELIDKYLTEAKGYPTQYDAEFVADISNMFAQISMGVLSSEFSTAFKKMDIIRMKLHDKAFGDKSPWGIKPGKGFKINVIWDKEKAEKLGL